MKTFLTIVIAVILIAGGFFLYERHENGSSSTIATSSSTSIQMVGTTTPIPTGGTASSTNATITTDMKVTYPIPHQSVSSPLSITGEARGNWFFEAVAPAYLEDSTGKKIAQGQIRATSDWMTTNFVSFTGSLTWSTSSIATTTGYVVLLNDNPSGDPSLQKTVRIPVTIAR